jgi:hypothetical protein
MIMQCYSTDHDPRLSIFGRPLSIYMVNTKMNNSGLPFSQPDCRPPNGTKVNDAVTSYTMSEGVPFLPLNNENHTTSTISSSLHMNDRAVIQIGLAVQQAFQPTKPQCSHLINQDACMTWQQHKKQRPYLSCLGMYVRGEFVLLYTASYSSQRTPFMPNNPSNTPIT